MIATSTSLTHRSRLLDSVGDRCVEDDGKPEAGIEITFVDRVTGGLIPGFRGQLTARVARSYADDMACMFVQVLGVAVKLSVRQLDP